MPVMPLAALAGDEAILTSVKRNEGWPKYTNRASDLGGPTKGGITLDTFRTWRKSPKLTATDLQRLTEPEADAIYRWMFIRPFDLLPEPLKPYMVDLGVLRGPHAATTMLQDIAGVEADGWIGPVTINALDVFGITTVLVMIIGARFEHIAQRVRDNPTQAEYVNGWRARNQRFLPKEVPHADKSQPARARATSRARSDNRQRGRRNP